MIWSLGPSLVVKSWFATPEPTDAAGTYVQIQARRDGIVAWLLSLIGIDATYEVTIDGSFAHYRATSWDGKVNETVPLGAVNSFSIGYQRPWQTALFIGFFAAAVLGSLLGWMANSKIAPFAGFIGWCAGIGLGIVYYLLNKSMTLRYQSGLYGRSLRLKRSVLENQTIDEPASEKISRIVETLLDARRL